MALKKAKKDVREDVLSIRSEVAAFATSLGLTPAAPSVSASGFDDSDFLKSGPINRPSNPKPSAEVQKNSVPRSSARPHPLGIDPFPSGDSKKDVHATPLMSPATLSGQWYVDAEQLESKVIVKGKGGAAGRSVVELKELAEEKKKVAERLMETYSREYDAMRRRNGDMKMIEAAAKSGTSTDKVSAFTCLVEDNPIANVRSLDALLSMVTSKVGKRYAFTGFDALKDLFLLRLLPDRKLKYLIQRPLNQLPESKDGFSLLLFWHWEECLKLRYEKFIIALVEALKDMLPNLKDKAMKTVYMLLRNKSEQERRLLSALVNKLGDPERKTASSAGYHLSCLLSAHPNMKVVVVDEVDSFIFRPRITLQAKYHAVNFLSQILLSKKGDGPRTAKKLVDLYFTLFKVLISEDKAAVENSKSSSQSSTKRKDMLIKGSKKLGSSVKEAPLESNVVMDSRLLSVLLTGVNRAFPFVSSDESDDIIEVQTPILFKLVHSENFNVGVQALMLLYQISSKNQVVSDRFYRSLYSKLSTSAAVNSSKPELFLGVLVKAMKNDINLKRIAAFSKRLLQVALQQPPQYACGCLFLLSEVLKAKPPLWVMMLQNESIDDELEHFEDIKEDIDITPNNSAIRSPEDLLNIPSLHNAENTSSNVKYSYNFDEAIDVHTQLDSTADANARHAQSLIESSLYNPRHRDPSYCYADRTAWWELTLLAIHVHPSVATMAGTLLSGANIVYNGDPLSDLSLNAFLNKFMEKKLKPNMKADGRWHGGSQIAPAKKLDTNHHLIGHEILQLAEEDVAPEDVVFHRFYMNKTSSSKRPKAKKSVADDEIEELLASSDGESEKIDNLLGSGELLNDESGGEYDYDDLDRVAREEEDDLLSDCSYADAEHPVQSIAQKHGCSESDDDINIWDDAEGMVDEDIDDVVNEDGIDDVPGRANRKRKWKLPKTGESAFANLEDYEHLLQDYHNSPRIARSKVHKKRKASL